MVNDSIKDSKKAIYAEDNTKIIKLTKMLVFRFRNISLDKTILNKKII